MIQYQKWGIRVAEIWLDEPPPSRGVDIVLHAQRSEPVPGSICTTQHTILIGLGETRDAILSGMSKHTRQVIRRCEKEQEFECGSCCAKDKGAFDEFCAFYDTFAAERGLLQLHRARMWRFAEAGLLDLSFARNADGNTLVWHANLLSETRARALYSASNFRHSGDAAYRNMVGRANRYLHWNDMLRFKALGIKIYDFGGWYSGQSDPERLQINRFKEGFGGTIVCEYNCDTPKTLRGWAALKLHSLRRIGNPERTS